MLALHLRTQSSSYLTSSNWSPMLCCVLSLRPLFIYFVSPLSNSVWCWETRIMSLSEIIVDVVIVRGRYPFCTSIATGWCACSQSSEKLTLIGIFFAAWNSHSLWKCSCPVSSCKNCFSQNASTVWKALKVRTVVSAWEKVEPITSVDQRTPLLPRNN